MMRAVQIVTMHDALKEARPAKTSCSSLLLQEERVHLFLFYLQLWTIDTNFSQVLMTTTVFVEKNFSNPIEVLILIFCLCHFLL